MAGPRLFGKNYIGPLLSFRSYDPESGVYNASVLVVTHPLLEIDTPSITYSAHSGVSNTSYGRLLDEFDGFRFWQFDIDTELGDEPSVLVYTVPFGEDRRYSVQLPGRNQPWRWMFYSCNGFHNPKAEKELKGIQPLWSDALKQHAANPYHVQVGGGDQIYNDCVWDLPSLEKWEKMKPPEQKSSQEFSEEMKREVEQFYFNHYCQHFSEEVWNQALATIPYIFTWDDHDIFDGWGSYPSFLQTCPVFQGIFQVARRFYLLFQQHCTEKTAQEMLCSIGCSYTTLRMLGSSTALLMVDTRSERSRETIVSPETWSAVKEKLEELPRYVRHLVVCLTVPIVYPKIPGTEELLSSMSGLNKQSPLMTLMNKTGMASQILGMFDEPEILDDLMDHWTAATHRDERERLVLMLQEIAARLFVRVTFISGDVHCAAVGRFYTYPRLPSFSTDHRFMPQIVSSAIGNEPPPAAVIAAFHKTNMAADLTANTREKMVKRFPHDVKLYAQRNYCEVTEHPYDEGAGPTWQKECGKNGEEVDTNGALDFIFRCQHPKLPVEEKVDVWNVLVPVLRSARG